MFSNRRCRKEDAVRGIPARTRSTSVCHAHPRQAHGPAAAALPSCPLHRCMRAPQSPADVRIRQHPSAYLSDACERLSNLHTSTCASMRQHPSAYVSIHRCMRASERPATRRMLGCLQAARATGPPQPPHPPRERDPPLPPPAHARSPARGSASGGKRTAKLVAQK